MAISEKRTYAVVVGRMAEVIALYEGEGWPALIGVGAASKVIGYFTSDTGLANQLVHLWRFDDDADRRAFWAKVNTDSPTQSFLKQLRPMLLSQEVQLLKAASWGPQP